MIVVDTSALYALLTLEDSAPALAARAADASSVLISAATVTEAGIVVLRRLGLTGLDELKGLCADMQLDTVALSASQAEIAVEAYRQFGRGSGSPARLNFGNCFSYALAKSLNAPLLFVGDDFNHTDIQPAMR